LRRAVALRAAGLRRAWTFFRALAMDASLD
jgi:hypothetical protein